MTQSEIGLLCAVLFGGYVLYLFVKEGIKLHKEQKWQEHLAKKEKKSKNK